MFFIYSCLFAASAAALLPYYAWRYRKTTLLKDSWRDRLGYVPKNLTAPLRGSIWVHAVSVGETMAAAGLVDALQARYPERPIYISHVTPTGREAGEKRLPGIAGRFFLPLDLRGPLNRALNRLKPELLVVVETELWPNLLRAAHNSGARVAVVNARLSPRSMRGYRAFRFLMRPVLSNVDSVMAQSEGDAQRFVEIGASPERVATTGNLKFDSEPPVCRAVNAALEQALASAGRGPVLVAASTMQGEEELVLGAWREIRRRYPRGLLILAPRHPPRFDRVAALLAAEPGGFVRRSALDLDNAAPADLSRTISGASILLLDSLGELAGIFELATVVFVGGSLVPTGGHNLLEPAWWAKPVVFGPHMENFRDAAGLFLEAHAAVQVRDVHELENDVIALFEDADRRRRMGEAARSVVERQRGATGRTMERIAALLEGAPSSGMRA